MIKVNLKTLTVTREELPKFLQGLKQESLQNLSWTDKALGVSAYGYWDEVDVTPALLDSQLYDGTETLVADKVAKVVNVIRGARNKNAEELANEEAERVAIQTAQAKEAQTLALNTATVTITGGKVFDARDKDLVRMMGAIQTAERNAITSTNWKLHNDVSTLVTLAELKEAQDMTIFQLGQILVGN